MFVMRNFENINLERVLVVYHILSRGVILRILQHVDFWALMSVAMFLPMCPFSNGTWPPAWRFFNMARPLWPNPSSAIAQGYVASTHKRSDNLRCVKEKRGKEGDRDLVYYSATTRYYAITMHFKRKVIVFSSSWRFLLNLSTDNLRSVKEISWIICLTCACNGCNQIYVWMNIIDKRWIPTLVTTIQEYGYQLTDDIDQYQLY